MSGHETPTDRLTEIRAKHNSTVCRGATFCDEAFLLSEVDRLTEDRERAALAGMPSGGTCPHGDECCPCPDGDQCHYEDPRAWPSPMCKAPHPAPVRDLSTNGAVRDSGGNELAAIAALPDRWEAEALRKNELLDRAAPEVVGIAGERTEGSVATLEMCAAELRAALRGALPANMNDLLTDEQHAELNAGLADMARKRQAAETASANLPVGSARSTEEPEGECDLHCSQRAYWLGPWQPCTGGGHVPESRCRVCRSKAQPPTVPDTPDPRAEIALSHIENQRERDEDAAARLCTNVDPAVGGGMCGVEAIAQVRGLTGAWEPHCARHAQVYERNDPSRVRPFPDTPEGK